MTTLNDGAAVLPAAEADAPLDIPAPKHARGNALGFALGGVVGAVLGVAAMRLLDGAGEATRDAMRAQLGAWTLPAGVAIALFAAWLAIAVHEAGHSLGGAVARFRFHFLIVGPLRIARDETTDRVRVGLNRELSLYGGVAASMPADTHDLVRRLGYLIAGGPLASVALALAAWAAATVDALPPVLRFLLGALAMVSGAVAAITLVPLRASGFSSDGARLLRMLRGGPAAEREAATLPLIALATAEVRPREWPRELVERATALRDDSPEECYAALCAYYRALDGGETSEAGRWIDRVVALSGTFPPAFTPALFAEAAYFEARHRRRAERARALLSRVPEKTAAVKPHDRARAEAALALASGDLAAAREHAERGLAQAPAKAAFTRGMLEEIRRAAEAPAAVAAGE